MIIDEFKRSLKMPEAEEILDLIFYRPLAFLFVKAVYRTPITPNQVTFLSMIAALVGAWYFSVGSTTALLFGAVWYAFANILDCSDGQLARLQNSGTLFGRVVDGLADYVASVGIFLGIGIGLDAVGYSQWPLVIAGGLSSAFHAFFFDQYQGEFISTVRSEENFVRREVERFEAELRRLRNEHRGMVKVFVLQLYLRYLYLQKTSTTGVKQQPYMAESYRSANLRMIRLWSILGPTTNRSLLIVCALFGRVDLFLWIVCVFGNLWLISCLMRQRMIYRQLRGT